MNKIILILITASMFFTKGYAQQAEVLTLGVFHFEFPNLDVQQVSEEDQIDVLSPQYQKEIELISKKLAQFKPDAVVIDIASAPGGVDFDTCRKHAVRAKLCPGLPGIYSPMTSARILCQAVMDHL